jgi:hypothetical protein
MKIKFKQLKEQIHRERMLLITLVAVAFFGFILWSIQDTSSEEISLIDNTSYIVQPLSNKVILVSAPKANVAIQSPLTISGQILPDANKLKVRIKDSKGLILAESFVYGYSNAAPGSLKMPFSIKLNFRKPVSKNGAVEVFKIVPKNNSEIYKITVPVTFQN